VRSEGTLWPIGQVQERRASHHLRSLSAIPFLVNGRHTVVVSGAIFEPLARVGRVLNRIVVYTGGREEKHGVDSEWVEQWSENSDGASGNEDPVLICTDQSEGPGCSGEFRLSNPGPVQVLAPDLYKRSSPGWYPKSDDPPETEKRASTSRHLPKEFSMTTTALLNSKK